MFTERRGMRSWSVVLLMMDHYLYGLPYLLYVFGTNVDGKGNEGDKGDQSATHKFTKYRKSPNSDEIIKQKEEVKKISDPVARRRACFTPNLKNFRIIHQGRVIHSPQIASVDDKEIISIEVSRQISPKVNSESSIESPILSSLSISSLEASEYSLDEFDNDVELFEMVSNKVLSGIEFCIDMRILRRGMDSDKIKTKILSISLKSFFKSLSDEFETGWFKFYVEV
ncbi:hypothetical protein Tco_1336807 [Tanacetum coccineum]